MRPTEAILTIVIVMALSSSWGAACGHGQPITQPMSLPESPTTSSPAIPPSPSAMPPSPTAKTRAEEAPHETHWESACPDGPDPNKGKLDGSPLDDLPSHITQLTDFGMRAHWSPDGERIVFSGFLRTETPQVNIWTIPVEGGEPTQLTSSPTQDRYPCWSPDGTSVAFIRTSEGECGGGVGGGNIFVVPREGGAVRQLTNDTHQVLWGKIAYSPNGNSIAYFARDTSISLIPAEGGDPQVVVRKGVKFSHHSELSWSPDGRRIAYSGHVRPVPGHWSDHWSPAIWVVSLDGGEPIEIETGVLTGDTESVHLAWSPDGETIAFSTWWEGDVEFRLISDFLPQER